MLKRISSPKDLPEHEIQNILRPSLLGVLLLSILLGGFAYFTLPNGEERTRVLFVCSLGVGYSIFLLFRFRYYTYQHPVFRIIFLLFHAGLSILSLDWVPQPLLTFPATAILLAVTMTSILMGRGAAYTYLGIVLLGLVGLHLAKGTVASTLPGVVAISVLAMITVEFIGSMFGIHFNRIRRLQIINEFARRINSTIEQEQVLAILGEAIRNAIQIDTCFVAVAVDEEHLFVLLIYDDGQYFPPCEVEMEGTLSGWVIRNQRSLFIADLRQDVNLTGGKTFLTGNNRDNVCWMGVPMKIGEREGVLAVASYTAGMFDRTDLELLENLAQHTALALHNANHHAEVEFKAQLDSLTNVYNHASIIRILERELEKAHAAGKPLSLIMLDIDYFKQYNDTYGHQTGDEVLVQLAQTIKRNIKSTDAVGRWGGEEFAIILPNASGAQALQVAMRLQIALRNLFLHPPEAKTLPFPTISQGIAEFPSEATKGEKLIQLADRRLYIAKARGRNQVEPEQAYWEEQSADS
ncbi:MAG: hypothetical protein DDG60_06285 [Anaerolineae bacterium]|nr:MAG: hypothetical protein DDG60_06285 [Anaerolineae bacterium]